MSKVGVVAPDPYGNFNAEQWEQWLAREKWCGGNHPKKAAELILQIVRGIGFVQNKVMKEGFQTFQRPPLVIVKESPEDCANKFSAYLPKPNVIALSPDDLQVYSNLPFDRIIESARATEVSMRATAPDHALLLGVEECHHSVYRQQHGEQPLPANINQLSVAEYDALDHEYAALRFQVLAAKEFNLPKVTGHLLVQRWQAANILRQRSG